MFVLKMSFEFKDYLTQAKPLNKVKVIAPKTINTATGIVL